MNNDRQATIIKIAAIVTAAPRWVAALLAAEGLVIPTSWLVWWLPTSAIMGAGMAIVEGMAFSYVFNAWRNQQDSKSNRLLILAAISAVVFVAVLSPYIAASVNGVPLAAILDTRLSLYVWSASVALSTIMIVASVGYAQKARAVRTPGASTVQHAQHPCASCGASFDSSQRLASHVRWTHRNGHKAKDSTPVT